MPYQFSIDIDASPQRVWEVLVDVERWPEWTPSMTSVERLEPGMFRTGSSARIKQPRLPEAVWRVSSLVPQESFTWSTRSRGVATVARHVIRPLDGGRTRAESFLSQSGLLAWLSRLFFSGMIRRYLEQEAAGLKRRCEAG